MNPQTVDRIARVLAERRLTRRDAMREGTAVLAAGAAALAGVAAAAASEATPAVTSATPASALPGPRTEFLFVQSFEQGTVGPKAGASGTFELTLANGLGHTLFFSDRPERIVGAAPTPQFLKGMNFPVGNPPNAALVAEVAPGDEDIAVLELTNPRYDSTTNTATYDVIPLKDYRSTLDMRFQEEPTDLPGFKATFGAAHLFIDDCANYDISCCAHWDSSSEQCLDSTYVGDFPNQDYCYSWGNARCIPCMPYYHGMPYNPDPGTNAYWNNLCNSTFPACKNNCGSVW